jgi:hypothetical protein
LTVSLAFLQRGVSSSSESHFMCHFFLKRPNFLRSIHWSSYFILLNPYSNFNMENINIFLLTSTNYFQWKSHMEDLLRSKRIYKIMLGTEIAPNDDENKSKWEKKMIKFMV